MVTFLMFIVAMLDVVVNIFLLKMVRTNFHWKWAALMTLTIAVGFYLFAWIAKTYDEPISVIYIMLSEFGILGTLAVGYFVFGQKVTKPQILGIFLVMVSIALFEVADSYEEEPEVVKIEEVK